MAEYTVLLRSVFVFSCAKMTPPLGSTASLGASVLGGSPIAGTARRAL
jgi:hypothetical protein